jgi:hypothetical protein
VQNTALAVSPCVGVALGGRVVPSPGPDRSGAGNRRLGDHTRGDVRAPIAVGNASEKEVKGFYQFLADWEKQHLEALRTLYNSVRQDFFAAGSFSPF